MHTQPTRFQSVAVTDVGRRTVFEIIQSAQKRKIHVHEHYSEYNKNNKKRRGARQRSRENNGGLSVRRGNQEECGTGHSPHGVRRPPRPQ